ncbi:MAG: DNA mismatch repair protein MutS [Andreesenia angusta]|nr:DNA mismatch repair protein MutS [Andreesenia angusta]
MAKLTPMMKQYMDIKEKHQDSILFFRLGDFYEMFFDDALKASKELEITLTARDCGLKEKAPMCGVPYHSSDGYIRKLIEKGYKVAICEQVEDPSEAVGIVKRDVIKIITSGTVSDPKMLDEKSNNYLASLFIDKNMKYAGISYTDITVGEIFTSEIPLKEDKDIYRIVDEIGKIMPKELLTNIDLLSEEYREKFLKFESSINYIDSWYFDYNSAVNNIKSQFKIASLQGIGLERGFAGIYSTGAILEYLFETQKTQIENIRRIHRYNIDDFMVIDINTRRNLELLETIRGNRKKGSLLSILDYTQTSMGGRMLKKWIEEPLLDRKKIENRLNFIENLLADIILMDELGEGLRKVYDMERLISRIAQGSANGRVLLSLKNSVSQLPYIKEVLNNSNIKAFKEISEKIDPLDDVFNIIDSSIEEECPIGVNDGNLIKETYSEELKELRDISRNGKKYLLEIERKEQDSTGIKNLKISYNKVFGYFIEVTKSHLDKVPKHYIRKQTLANSERYIIDELKDIENKILNSRDKMIKLENELFNEVRNKIKKEVDRIQKVSRIIASLDSLLSLARAAYINNYNRPIITDGFEINIKAGRHPVVENMIEENSFVSNDTLLDCDENRINIITGPNMSGKSTYMRQVALITLMAQIGSFVPADECKISLVDKIFTRIGATDDLSEGQSTFMVEMTEVANILNNATEKSLIILDEIGRGTSTYDGLSIAWSVVEYISKKNKIGAKTLFATHYHELTELEDKIEGIKNYRVSVEEKENEGIIFLRKIERGGADRSYGIEVARLAGISNEVIKRAYNILDKLETEDINNKGNRFVQESFFDNINVYEEKKFDSDMYNEIIEEIKSMKIINMTPLEAMNKLYEIVEKLNSK